MPEEAPLVYIYGGKTPLQLIAPQRSNFNFEGFYYNSDFSGQKVTELDDSYAYGQVLFAKWEPDNGSEQTESTDNSQDNDDVESDVGNEGENSGDVQPETPAPTTEPENEEDEEFSQEDDKFSIITVLPPGTDGTAGPEGEYILFGRWSYDPSQSLKWRIIDKDENGRALILSEYILDERVFNLDSVPCSYERSLIRDYLNDVFLTSSFSPAERDRIAISIIKTNGENDIADRIFLLSYDELFLSDKFTQESRQRRFINNYDGFDEINLEEDFSWWLRTSVSNPNLVDCVYTDGHYNRIASFHTIGVVPALWIYLY